MQAASPTAPQARRQRPRAFTVFLAAFVAGAAAAVGVNRVLDVHLAQKKPRVESEPIFVALRSLPQGSPVTVWDVALRDWPKAMLPTTAMRADDSFDGCVLRHPLREGQPLLSLQLVRPQGPTAPAEQPAAAASVAPPAPLEADLWTPAPAAAALVPTPAVTQPEPPVAAVPAGNPAPPPTDVPPPTSVASGPNGADVPPPAEADEAPAVPAGDEPLAVIADPLTVDTATLVAAPDRGDVAPADVVTGGEPTLADPVPNEPTPSDAAPPVEAALESVVVTPSASAPDGAADPTTAVPSLVDAGNAPPAEPAAVGKPPAGLTRYLVVPERIALQVDAGFAPPPQSPAPGRQPEPAPQAEAPQRKQHQQVPSPARQHTAAQPGNRPTSPSPGSLRPVPPANARQAAPATRPLPAAQARPPRQPQQRQRSTPPPGWQGATTGSPGRGPMFPTIAAGIDALTGGTRRGRDGDGGYNEAVATDDPAYRP